MTGIAGVVILDSRKKHSARSLTGSFRRIGRETIMENIILFLNSFLSYLVLMLIILVVMGIAVAIGLTLRKRKNKAQEAAEAAKAAETVETAVSQKTE